MMHTMRLLIVILFTFSCVAASAATLTGHTVRVTDGDTIVILSEGNVQHKIRLQGIDALERRTWVVCYRLVMANISAR